MRPCQARLEGLRLQQHGEAAQEAQRTARHGAQLRTERDRYTTVTLPLRCRYIAVTGAQLRTEGPLHLPLHCRYIAVRFTVTLPLQARSCARRDRYTAVTFTVTYAVAGAQLRTERDGLELQLAQKALGQQARDRKVRELDAMAALCRGEHERCKGEVQRLRVQLAERDEERDVNLADKEALREQAHGQWRLWPCVVVAAVTVCCSGCNRM